MPWNELGLVGLRIKNLFSVGLGYVAFNGLGWNYASFSYFNIYIVSSTTAITSKYC